MRALLQPSRQVSARRPRAARRSSENAVVYRWGHRFPGAWLAAGGYLVLLLTSLPFEPSLVWTHCVVLVLGYTVLVMERERRGGTWELLVATGMSQTAFLAGWRQHLLPRLVALLLAPVAAACWAGSNPVFCILLACSLLVVLLEASTLAWMARQEPMCVRFLSWFLWVPLLCVVVDCFPHGSLLHTTLFQAVLIVVLSVQLVWARCALQQRCFGRQDWLRPFSTTLRTKDRPC